MIFSKVNRRATKHLNSQGEKFDAAVVRQGILLKLDGNTLSAIEYMTNRGVSSAIIQRVLSGPQLREDDKLAIASYTHSTRV